MKELLFFKNRFPLEPLLPDLNEPEIDIIVKTCDYTIEANAICEHDKIENKVNIPDAVVFYSMGYEKARREIEKKLMPIEKI